MNYKEDILINLNNLTEAWQTQPSKYLYYAEMYANASSEKDFEKIKLDRKYSNLFIEVKSNWQKYFKTKPTEAVLKGYIKTMPEYLNAENKYMEITRKTNKLLAIKTAFDHRKKALENLVSLQITGFFSTPKNKAEKIYKSQSSLNEKKEQNIKLQPNERLKRRKRNDILQTTNES